MHSEEGEGGDGSKADDRTRASLGLISAIHTRVRAYSCVKEPTGPSEVYVHGVILGPGNMGECRFLWVFVVDVVLFAAPSFSQFCTLSAYYIWSDHL